MRKSLLIACVVTLAGLSASAQNSAINTAIFAKQNFDYVKAKASIDKAVAHEKTSTSAKAWYYHGEIYQNIAAIKSDWNNYVLGLKNISAAEYTKALTKTDDEIAEIQNLSEDPSGVAFDSYMKSAQFDTKGKHKNDIDRNLRSLTIVDFNKAGDLYNDGVKGKEVDKEKLTQSYIYYERVLKMIDAMTAASQESFKSDLTSGDDDDGDAMDLELNFIDFYMARVAYYSDQYDLAKKRYNKLIDINYNSVDIYRELAVIYQKENDIEAERALWAKARENRPSDNLIAIDEAAFYQRIGETEVLLTKLEEAIKLNPETSSLYNVLGGIYTQKIVNHNSALSSDEKDALLDDATYKKYRTRAEELLTKAQELNESEVSNYSQLGTLYLSEGLVAYNANNQLGFSAADKAKSKKYVEQFKASFAQAQVQFEKALVINSDNTEAQEYLNKIQLWSN